MEYNVELIESTVQKLAISVNTDKISAFQIKVDNSASVFEPNDENDPTIMVRTDCKMRDSESDQLSIDMTVEFIFKFDPVPEDRTAIAAKYCPQLMIPKLNELAVTFVRNMGHDLAFGK